MAVTDILGSYHRLWRYYQAGIVNTAFGYGLYALLVWLGLPVFAAQLVAHFVGVAFNYFTYSRFAFPDATAARLRFTFFYVFTYLLGAAMLAVALQFFASPYVAGFVAVVVMSILNYIILRQFVFLAPIDKP